MDVNFRLGYDATGLARSSGRPVKLDLAKIQQPKDIVQFSGKKTAYDITYTLKDYPSGIISVFSPMFQGLCVHVRPGQDLDATIRQATQEFYQEPGVPSQFNPAATLPPLEEGERFYTLQVEL